MIDAIAEEATVSDAAVRIPPVPEGEEDPAIRPTLEALASGWGGRLNVFATLAHHPALLQRWLSFAAHVLMQSTLPPRDRELLILRTACNNDCGYEFGHHRFVGERDGLSSAEVERVRDGPEAHGWTEADRTLLRAADELTGPGSRVGDATWMALAERFDTTQLMDIVFCVGQYTMLSMALNSFGVQLEEGVTGF